MKFKVYLQKPKPRKRPLTGSLAMNRKEKVAEIYGDNGKCLAELCNAELVAIGGEGILLKGLVRRANGMFFYQEWYCVFPKKEE